MKFKLRKTFPTEINNKREMTKAINEFGLNYCKASEKLKKDKGLALEAVEQDAYSVMYMTDEMRQDKDIQNAVHAKRKSLDKYIFPLEDLQDKSLLTKINLSGTEIVSEEIAKSVEKEENQKKIDELRASLYGRQLQK